MIRIVCEECGKSYNYEVDDFCPKCGAYNQPPKKGAPTAVVRTDGVNEQNHAGSFVHEEVHQEKKIRQKFGLDQRPKARPSFSRQFSAPRQPSAFPKKGTGQKTGKGSSSGVVTIIIWIFIVLVFVSSCAF